MSGPAKNEILLTMIENCKPKHCKSMQLNRHVKALLRYWLLPTKTTSKLFLVMRLTAILLTVACLQASAGSYAQKVTLSAKKQSLETVFKEIKSQTGYVFWYKLDMLKHANKVTISVVDQDLAKVLDAIFKDQPLVYEIVDKTIAIKIKDPAAAAADAAVKDARPMSQNAYKVDVAKVAVKRAILRAAGQETGGF